MRKILLAGTAIAVVMAAGSAGAADLSRPILKAPPPIPVFSWTGWYVGVHVGGAWGTKEWQDPVVTAFDGVSTTTFSFPDTTIANYGVNGFLGGLQIGYNYQSGPWVWGVEAQGSWAGIRGSDACPFFAGKATCRTNVDALGSFAVRFGGTIDRAMLYVKGGPAWAWERHRTDAIFCGKAPGACTTVSTESKHWRWGGMLGAGVEFAFTNSISGKLEYNYMDFGTRTYTFGPISSPGAPPGFGETVDVKIRQNIHLVKVGLNFRWDVGKAPVAVMAKY